MALEKPRFETHSPGGCSMWRTRLATATTLSLLSLAVVAAAGKGQVAPSNGKVWENYDFVPGSKVMFYTDFSEDRVGNFARALKYLSGPMEIVERDDVKMLRASGPGEL